MMTTTIPGNDAPVRISDPAQFGRVAVVMGGSSAEREVSLDSGRNVLAALKSRGVDAHAIDGIPALLDALRAGHFARVFNILHGQHGGGEDGVLQGAQIGRASCRERVWVAAVAVPGRTRRQRLIV